ncbi:MAG: lipopolysaccharide heptosyltransferase II [Deltaproteobacteria bacterium]|nr:lipopolysaccharide heptosyltransferase II [Deltaproteobacteria bacterium]MBW2052351.1 lipopolysaccharide heptosyltransferase II [Deltaproteobacteria bacterium]MBW2139796.1 lipopolysaccharide heptosyltransferase II [Deltaproteobacteria bacterium]MBW2322844.1 lipopolysaccharide heptosyltransferase II [Deltaproteobacteria bacterium]
MELTRSNIRRILVRSTNWVGDALLTTPALASLKANFPEARISVLARSRVTAVYEDHPAVDEIIIYDRERRHKGWSGFNRLAGEVRAKRFDLAVLFQHAFGAALLAWLARIPERLGYNTDGRGFLLNRAVRHRPEDKQIHEVESYQGLIRRSGLKVNQSNPIFHLPSSAEQWASARLSEMNLDGSFILGIAPGASYGLAKQWPPEKFAKAAQVILENKRGTALLFGSQSEVMVTKGIKEFLTVPAYDLAGRTDLAEVAALIKRCHLFLTNDSGLMHVGAAVGTPLVAIFGSTNPITTSPFTNNARVIRHPVDCAPCLKRVCTQSNHLCMELVKPEEVATAGLELIGKGGESGDGS